VAERQGRDALFGQLLIARSALATRWVFHLLARRVLRLQPAGLDPVDAPAATIWENYGNSETNWPRAWTRFACNGKRRRKSADLPQRQLVAECLHRYDGGGRRTCAGAQATDAR